MWRSWSLFEWVLTVVWAAWLNGTMIAWIKISSFCILGCRCGRASMCICGSVCVCVFVLINTSSIRVLNWAECEIWQAQVGLCGLPLHSNKTETCWHEYQMSRGSLLGALVHHLDDSGLERQTALHINISVFWHWWKNSARGRLLSISLKCQANVTCSATEWGGGGCQWVTFNVCVCVCV